MSGPRSGANTVCQLSSEYSTLASTHTCALFIPDTRHDTRSVCVCVCHAEVESHPFDLDTMLFMDWRDDHTKSNPEMHKANAAIPTFLYAMPFSKNK